MVVGCNARQCANLATVQRTKLWQLSQQSCHRCCTNAFDLTQKLADIRMVQLEVRCQLDLDMADLCLQRLDDRLDAFVSAWMSNTQVITLHGTHQHQLLAPTHQGG